jgi:hypothetical protein
MGRRRRRDERRDASRTRTVVTVVTDSGETAKIKPCSASWSRLRRLRGSKMIRPTNVRPEQVPRPFFAKGEFGSEARMTR